MFYHFLLPLQEYFSFLRLFKFITFRTMFATLTALIFVLFLGRPMIKWLQNLNLKEEIRTLGPESHQAKAGTPTMGGVIILSAILLSIILWGNFSSIYLVTLCLATLALGLLGFADDYIKSVRKKKDGLSAKAKLFVQIIVSVTVAAIVYYFPSKIIYPEQIVVSNATGNFVSDIFIPFVNTPLFNIGVLWILFASFVVIGSSNAVNLTDGLDGLATGAVLIVVVTMGIIAYLTGNFTATSHLGLPYIAESAEITVFLGATAGACLGFLWYNSNPASVFMGDTGSLALGGIIGIIAVMIKKEIFLFLVGGIFVLEALSVILQVGSYKLRKKRIFKMAPIHHHFELSGWAEQKVVARMWIIGIILALIGLSTLKIL